MENKNSIYTAVWVISFLLLTPWIFGPAYIYYTNSLEFNFSFSWIIYHLAGIALALILLTGGVVFLFRKKHFNRVISLLFVIALLSWIQGNLLVWNYGPLDGREIHWGQKWVLGLVDGALWILSIVLSQVKPGFFAKYARRASMAFIAIQAVSLTLAIVQAPKIPSFKYYYIDESTKFSFSAQENAVVLMLDTYQSDIFQEIINEEPRYKEMFRGFTYFRNTLSAAPKTYTSVPSFLTAHIYDNSVPMQDFLEEAYLSGSSLPKVLKDNGFRVELYPYPSTEKTIYFSEDVASNIKRRSSQRVVWGQLGFLVDISLFRQVPHYIKPYIYNDQKWFLKKLFAVPVDFKQTKIKLRKDLRFSPEALEIPDVRFISYFLANSSIDFETPVFKYYHLNGLHRPLNLDENLYVKQMPYNRRSSFKAQGKAGLEIARLLISKLKQLEIFDQTLIVVMGDHGCADYPYGVNLEAAGLKEKEGYKKRIPDHIHAAGLPLMLIKPIGAADEELKITDVDVSLVDLPRTVVSSLGIDREIPGYSMFEVQKTDRRERRYWYYNWNGWGDDFLYQMREYAVFGHAWSDSSWQELGIKRSEISKTKYRYGTLVFFDRKGAGVPYQGIGWHAPEQTGFTWSREKKAELSFSLDPPSHDIILTIVMKPFLLAGVLDAQELSIFANGYKVQKLVLTNPRFASYSITIPRERIRGTGLNIMFDIPTAAAPVDLNKGNDVRALGIGIKSVVVREKK